MAIVKYSVRSTSKIPDCPMAMSAEDMLKFAAFPGNGDISKWVKSSQVGRKLANKQNE